MPNKTTKKFDLSASLDSDAMMASYLNAVLEDGSAEDLVVALGHIAKAKGMTKIAEETGMSRPGLYKALSEGAQPRFDTILKVLRAIGGRLSGRNTVVAAVIAVDGICAYLHPLFRSN